MGSIDKLGDDGSLKLKGFIFVSFSLHLFMREIHCQCPKHGSAVDTRRRAYVISAVRCDCEERVQKWRRALWGSDVHTVHHRLHRAVLARIGACICRHRDVNCFSFFFC